MWKGYARNVQAFAVLVSQVGLGCSKESDALLLLVAVNVGVVASVSVAWAGSMGLECWGVGSVAVITRCHNQWKSIKLETFHCYFSLFWYDSADSYSFVPHNSHGFGSNSVPSIIFRSMLSFGETWL